LTFVAFIGIGAFAGLIVLIVGKANKAIVSIQQYRAKTMSLLLEGAANSYIIQAYGRTAYLDGRFNRWLNDTFRRVRAFLAISSCISPLSLLLFALVMTAVAFYGISELRSDRITVQQMITYCSYAVILILSGSQIGYLGGRLRQASLMLAKHQNMLAAVPAASPEARSTASRGLDSEPCGFLVQGLTFCYPEKSVPALTDVSFTLFPGSVNAIVGESGAGKSTVAGLLCGLYRPQSGLLSLTDRNGIPIGASAVDCRQDIALVPQEPYLFAASITENIAFGREDISEQRVHQAAMTARIHDFIMTLPDGYRTVIQEGGRNLSRGQRQRLSIARALAGNPSVMILDEATASLDVVSERAIKAAIEDLRGRVTFVVIAHQGAMLSNVDHIVYLQHGEVLFEGRLDQMESNNKARILSSIFADSVAGSLC
jgi:ATP-binding cassette subfamily B protein